MSNWLDNNGFLFKSLLSHDKDIMCGQMCITGTRITCDCIRSYTDGYATVDEILDDIDYLTEEQVRAAIAYNARRDIYNHNFALAMYWLIGKLDSGEMGTIITRDLGLG